MSASKKDELLRNLTKRDNQKPPMEVTYENKGLVLEQMAGHSQVESTPHINTTDMSDSNKEEMNTTQESDTNVEQIKTTNVIDIDNGQMNSTNVYDTNNVHIRSTQETASSVELIRSFKDSVKRETVEDTHTRKTFIVRNDLLRELEKMSRKQGRGFQTWFVNMAFERLLEDLKPSINKD